MKRISLVSRPFVLLILSFGTFLAGLAQVPDPALVGYFHNWNSANAPYIALDQIDNRYNVVEVSFAIPEAGTDYKMEFVPDQGTPAQFAAQIQTLQSQGKKVLISIGGATATVKLDNAAERDTFVSTMHAILTTYGFDGMDIDLEGSSVAVTGGTITAPTDASIQHLIAGIQQIMADFHAQNGKKLMLTMAPETAYVQGGQSAYNGFWGAYLPIIDALRDSIDILQVQLYNSGTMYGIDGGIYGQGTADFIVAMTEAVIRGFNTNGGQFVGLPAAKVAVALPACSAAAGGGYVSPAVVASAIDYLMGNGPQPGSYTLQFPAAYPDLRGMMTWSINWDALSTCGNTYAYAQTYEDLFGTVVTQANTASETSVRVYPNPARDRVKVDLPQGADQVVVELLSLQGQILQRHVYMSGTAPELDISLLPTGLYLVNVRMGTQLMTRRLMKQ